MVPPRRPLRDNPRLILAGMILLLAALAGIVALANRSAGLSPDFLTEFVLYGLWAADLTMLLGLTFVLARNVIKLIIERRRALPFARFRGKLVAVLLGMTLVPAVLVLLVGSELIRNSVDRWFNAPVEEVLTAADMIASDYYRDRQARLSADAQRIARDLAGAAFDGADVGGGTRSHPAGGHAGTREDGGGVSRAPGIAARGGDAVCRRRRAGHAARLRARGRRSHGGARGVGPARAADARTACRPAGELIRAAAVVRRAGGAGRRWPSSLPATS